MKYLKTLIFICITHIAFAQYPDTTIETPEIRAKAEKLTAIYDAKLGLDGTQLPIFQNKVADYLTLSKEIKESYKGKEALDKLTQLMVKESLEMKDLLTRIQYNQYKKIRQSVQPLEVVVNTDEK
ncbi:hypothetical protein V8G58_12010 [Gaetbulibacter aestuarii]|uniref:Peptidylprolyl isomerase n=2 Tax=Gaetbulibacter aestuarii TaxID=1502358 RepID=A0ABW7N0M4_9FLAO